KHRRCDNVGSAPRTASGLASAILISNLQSIPAISATCRLSRSASADKSLFYDRAALGLEEGPIGTGRHAEETGEFDGGEPGGERGLDRAVTFAHAPMSVPAAIDADKHVRSGAFRGNRRRRPRRRAPPPVQ